MFIGFTAPSLKFLAPSDRRGARSEAVERAAAAHKAHAALESVSVAVMMVDRDFKVTHVNRATKDLLRRTPRRFARSGRTLSRTRSSACASTHSTRTPAINGE